MADQEIATILQKVQEVDRTFEGIRKNAIDRQGTIKVSSLKPSYLLGDVLEKLGPLTAYVVADGDVTKAEMLNKAENEHIKSLIKPVQEAFTSANGRYKAAMKLTADTQITATEDLKKLEDSRDQLQRYDDRLKVLRNESTDRRNHITADLTKYKAQSDELDRQQKDLDKRWDDDQKVLHPSDDEPFWKKLGWALAGNREEGEIMSDREQIEEAARLDQKALDEQWEINEKQIEKTNELIRQEDDSLARVNDRLQKIEKLAETVPKAITDTKAFIKQGDEDISVLDKVAGEMDSIFPLLNDATAEAKAGFRIAYREKFAETILTITTQVPTDEKVKEQIALLLDNFKALPRESKLYTKLQPQLEAARVRIGQQTIRTG